MKKLIQYGIIALSLPLLVACSKSHGDNPGVEYAPDMYESKGYEPFSQVKDNAVNSLYNERNIQNMRLPVPGTVARGQEDYVYPYPNTTEGEAMSAAYKMKLERNDLNLIEGKRLFDINCAVCHGPKGNSDGTIVAAEKFPPPPLKYNSPEFRTRTEGQIYHTITLGKNLMGSYAPNLSPNERWMVVQYVQLLSRGGSIEEGKVLTDTAATAGSTVTASSISTTAGAGTQDSIKGSK